MSYGILHLLQQFYERFIFPFRCACYHVHCNMIYGWLGFTYRIKLFDFVIPLESEHHATFFAMTVDEKWAMLIR